jgi:hypothetical protein
MRRAILTIYDTVRAIMWILCAMWAMYAVYLIMTAPDSVQRWNAAIDEEMNRENWDFCTKFGPPKGSHEHVLCTMELKHLREDDGNRFSNAGLF